jgi:hypothetical protein
MRQAHLLVRKVCDHNGSVKTKKKSFGVSLLGLVAKTN